MQDLTTRIESAASTLTAADRRVAEAMLRDPEVVAFGTVATVAERAGTSGASVVRFANRLGYDGYTDLQASVQAAMGERLRPAALRIREPGAPHTDLVERARGVEGANVAATIDALDRTALAHAVDLLADADRRIAVIAGDAEHGIGTMLATALGMLRGGVEQVAGADAAVARQLASLGRGDVVLAIDLRRYERWVVEHVQHVAGRGLHILAITDSVLSPLAAHAAAAFTVEAEGVGPFDSHVGTLTVANILVAGVAEATRRSATARLDRIEASWRATGALASD